ncbi:MAG: hypothetical protein JOZ87_14230 [Chloroflexi bacterium]|nr:hypothetical protein [Chloroflexota bacterium]
MFDAIRAHVAGSIRSLLLGLTGVALALSSVAIVSAQSAPASPGPTPSPLPVVPYDEQHPVLAYYYAWWEPERLTAGLFQPVLMPAAGARQISDDPTLERAHITQAQSAGIDGFIVNRTSDLSQLLDVARGSDFRITYELDANADPVGQLQEFYRHVNDPGMVTYQGRPVLFFWQAPSRPNSFWSDLRAQFDPEHNAVWLTDGDQFPFMAGDAWDGISPYAIAWSPNPTAQLQAWGARARAAAPDKLYVPPVSPGCDDSVVRAPTCIRDRADGAYYQAALQGAQASSPSWAVVVCSWNEWLESTSIEPAAQYGDLYLQLTRQFAETFKGPH